MDLLGFCGDEVKSDSKSGPDEGSDDIYPYLREVSHSDGGSEGSCEIEASPCEGSPDEDGEREGESDGESCDFCIILWICGVKDGGDEE